MVAETCPKLAAAVAPATSVTILGRGPSARFALAHGATHPVIGNNLVVHRGTPLRFAYLSRAHELPATGSGSTQVPMRDDCEVLTESAAEAALQGHYSPLTVGSIHFGLLTLLTLLNELRDDTALPLTARLVGFDFRSYSSDDDVEKQARGRDWRQVSIDVSSQRELFFSLRTQLTRIRTIHYGFDPRSDYDPRSWPDEVLQTTARPAVEVVAEITTNHLGSSDRLRELIHGAAAAGADAVKLQMRDVLSFYTSEKLASAYESPFGNTFLDYRKGLELSDAQIDIAVDEARANGLSLFFSALDEISLRRILDRGFSRVKLPSTISDRRRFLQFASDEFPGEVVISTGMTEADYEQFILDRFKRQSRLFLLHCISAYPAWPGDLNLAVVNRYSRIADPRVVAGYSSHDIGSDASILAVGAGARMLEKHIKIGTTDWVHFDDTAMDVHAEFPDYVRRVRAAEGMLGSDEKRILPSEHHKY
jgi:sialic acid synthase SpsE